MPDFLLWNRHPFLYGIQKRADIDSWFLLWEYSFIKFERNLSVIITSCNSLCPSFLYSVRDLYNIYCLCFQYHLFSCLLLKGCPSTLGANRKSADFFERVPARDKNVRALFSERVISQIERDVGCKIKMDEKFLIVSGKDRLILAKGVDAVHKVIQEDKGKSRSPTGSNRTRSRSPDESPRGAELRRSESQRSHSSPRNASRFQSRGFNQDRHVQDHVREGSQKILRGSSQGRVSMHNDNYTSF